MILSSTSYSTAIVKASDGAEIEVTLPPGETFESKYVQILGNIHLQSLLVMIECIQDSAMFFVDFSTGKVTRHGCIDATRVQSAGENFHMDNYEQTINLINDKYRSMFE